METIYHQRTMILAGAAIPREKGSPVTLNAVEVVMPQFTLAQPNSRIPNEPGWWEHDYISTLVTKS